MFKTLWLSRDFIIGSVKREFQSKYRNSVLGVAWTLINPLAMILVYTVIFSQVMQTRLPGVDSVFAYSIYLCSGILTWGLFSEITGRGLTVFIDNANLIKKLSFPRICLPMIVVLSASLNFAIIFGIFSLFLVASGSFPGLVYLYTFPVLIVQIGLSIGLGIILGVLNVFFRDVGQFYGVFLQFLFWFTPVVYPVSILPDWIRPIIKLNPMTSITDAYHKIFVAMQSPDWISLLPVTLFAAAICVLGFRMFRKRVGEIVDEL